MLSILPRMKKWQRLLAAGTILILLLTLLALFGLSPAVAGGSVTVSIYVPGKVTKGAEFVARVDVSQVDNFDSASYDVSFNPSIVEVTSITGGKIGETDIPVIWNQTEPGIIKVLQNIPGVPGVSGSGYLAEIRFHVLGSPGQSSNITLTNGILVNNTAQEILADWLRASVEVSVEVEEVTQEISAPPVVVLQGVTLVASYVTEDGIFTRDVTAQSRIIKSCSSSIRIPLLKLKQAPLSLS